jgi:predicted MFS family arabinose efflux permease
VQFTCVLDFLIMLPIGPQLIRVFSMSSWQLGFLISAYSISAALSGFISAFYIDRFDRKYALITIYMGFTLGELVCALSPGYSFLMAGRIICGAFGGLLGALIISVIGDAVSQERRGQVTGFVMSSFSLASIFGLPVCIYMSTHIAWHTPFNILASLCSVILLLIYVYLPELKMHLTENKNNVAASIKNIYRNSPFMALCFMGMLMLGGGFAILPYLSSFLVMNIGLPDSDLSYVFIIGGVATLITSPLMGKLTDYFGMKKIFIIAAVFSALSILGVTHLKPQFSVSLIYFLCALFFVFMHARFIAATSLVLNAIDASKRGSFMSLNSAVQQIAGSLGTITAAYIITDTQEGKLQHFDMVGLLAITATAICIFISLKFKAGNKSS